MSNHGKIDILTSSSLICHKKILIIMDSVTSTDNLSVTSKNDGNTSLDETTLQSTAKLADSLAAVGKFTSNFKQCTQPPSICNPADNSKESNETQSKESKESKHGGRIFYPSDDELEENNTCDNDCCQSENVPFYKRRDVLVLTRQLMSLSFDIVKGLISSRFYGKIYAFVENMLPENIRTKIQSLPRLQYLIYSLISNFLIRKVFNFTY